MTTLKKHFLLDPQITFLNHGSFGATPKPVFKEYQRWQRELENQPVEFLGRRITDLLAESRAALGSYLGAHGDNLIYAQNVTVALNIVARSLTLTRGDEVLASDHEYGAMDRTWRFLSKENGFTYLNQPVKLTSHQDFVESFWSGVTVKTKVIFLSHITSPTALIFPIQEIIKRARERNIITIIDGAHVPGQIPLDLDSLGADFYGGNLHKWLCAPKGAGFLYARPEMQNLIKPLVVSWGYEPEIAGVSPFIDQQEWIGTHDPSAYLTVPAAIQFQQDQAWDEVRSACHRLAKYAQAEICNLTGLSPLHSQSENWFAQMASAPLPEQTDLAALKKRLYDEYKIEIPLTAWNNHKLIRVSVQGYNTKKELDYLLKTLSAVLS
ncbi:MAG: aminotransferase class V-fold PLP-dependent enzyme [Anaerolineales bacterium]|nr:aminotransferase class V-fold PLP-dependent enzyme [Anaerolineales bacterium]